MSRTILLGMLALAVAACNDPSDPGRPSTLEIALPAGGARAGAAFVVQPVIRIVDGRGNIVIHATEEVSLTVSSGAQVVGTATAVPVDGVATFRDAGLVGSAGSHTLTYSAMLGGSTRTVTQVIDLGAGAAARLVLQTPASGARGGLAFITQPVVRVEDVGGNLIGTEGSVFLIAGQGAAIVGPAAARIVEGIARFSGTGIWAHAGTHTVTYSGPAPPITQTIELNPGAPVGYELTTDPPVAEAGATMTVAAQLRDAAGAAVPQEGHVVTWTSNGTGGRFGSATSVTDAGGVATVAFTVDTLITSDSITFRVGEPFMLSGSTHVPTSGAAPVTFRLLDAPASVGWRVLIPEFRIALVDRYGNVVIGPGRQVTLTLESGPPGAALAGTTTVTAEGGVATFRNVVPMEAGDLVLRASSGDATALFPLHVDPVGTVTTSRRNSAFGFFYPFVNLAVTDSSVISGEFFASLNPVEFLEVPLTGGPSVSWGGTSGGSSNFVGRMFDDGDYVSVLHAMGPSFSTSARVLRMREPATETVLPLGFGTFGQQLEWDGTFFYAPRGAYEDQRTSGVLRIRASDGEITVLAPRSDDWLPHIAVGGGFIFVTDTLAGGQGIKRLPIDGGSLETVVATGDLAPGRWRRMLVVGSTLYWAERGDGSAGSGSIRSVPINGGTATVRATNLSPDVSHMASDGTYLYVRDSGSLHRFDLATFTRHTIAADDGVVDLAVGGDALYWASNRTSAPNTISKTQRQTTAGAPPTRIGRIGGQ